LEVILGKIWSSQQNLSAGVVWARCAMMIFFGAPGEQRGRSRKGVQKLALRCTPQHKRSGMQVEEGYFNANWQESAVTKQKVGKQLPVLFLLPCQIKSGTSLLGVLGYRIATS